METILDRAWDSQMEYCGSSQVSDIIYQPFLYLKQNVSETGFCLRLQVVTTQLSEIWLNSFAYSSWNKCTDWRLDSDTESGAEGCSVIYSLNHCQLCSWREREAFIPCLKLLTELHLFIAEYGSPSVMISAATLISLMKSVSKLVIEFISKTWQVVLAVVYTGWIYILHRSGRTRPQPITKINTRNIKIIMFLGSKVRRVSRSDKYTAICKPIV
jgi:hypothetical protein